MKIVVAVKAVDVLGSDVAFRDDGSGIDPASVETLLNEWDAFATEEALCLREAHGGEVVVVTCGSDASDRALRRCLAMGADRAIRLEGAAHHDPIAVARALAGVVRTESPDIVLCGAQSSDSAHGATGTALAEIAGLARIAVVTRIDSATPGTLMVAREIEGGRLDMVEVDLPALLTIQTGINRPRYVNLRALKRADAAEIEAHQAPATGTASSRIRRMFTPPRGSGATMLDGDAAAVAARIAAIVQETSR